MVLLFAVPWVAVVGRSHCSNCLRICGKNVGKMANSADPDQIGP